METVHLEDLGDRAGEAARLLRVLANEHRLRILCTLVSKPDMPVNALVETVGLSQSAVSQHLARLREDNLVATTREGQSQLYRVADPDTVRILTALKGVFCPDENDPA